MCGRYVIKATPEEIELAFRVDEIIADVQDNYNVAMTDDVLSVIQSETRRSLVSQQWGLLPVWTKGNDVKQNDRGKWVRRSGVWYNTTSEKLFNLPSFKGFLKRPCVIVAKYWIEFPIINGKKTPMLFGLATDELMGFAGHWTVFKAPDGREVVTCSIITTEANVLVAKYHDKKRMPVILDPRAQDAWLDPTNGDPKKLEKLFKPYPAKNLTVFQGSYELNKVGNRNPEYIKPVA